MSPVSHVPTERDPLAEKLDRAAHTVAHQTHAWPNLDGALRRDRRSRGIRRSTAGVLVASLVTAAVLPFTSVRVEPLDDLAAALGLRHSLTTEPQPQPKPQPEPEPVPQPEPQPQPKPQGMLQDVTKNPRDYVEVDGEALDAPAGDPVTDDAWLAAAKQRASDLLADAQPESSYRQDSRRDDISTWAVDDGSRRLAVIGFGTVEDAHRQWVVLSGPTGADAESLSLIAVGGLTDYPGTQPVGPEVVVVFDDRTTDPRVAGFPKVDAEGVVTTTWHTLPEVAENLWVGDLGAEAKYGWKYRLAPDDHDEGTTEVHDSWTFDEAFAKHPKTKSVDALANAEPFARFASNGYAGVTRSLEFGSMAAPMDGKDRTIADVRIVGVRTPGGGWVVAGDMRVTAIPAREVGMLIEEVGERKPLSMVVAAPASATGETPFVGFEPPHYDHNPTPWVIVWAPPRVKQVRSGDVVADVVDGVALLDLRTGGKRVAKETMHQSVLIEGLDAAGSVVARSRVRESHLEQLMNVDDQGRSLDKGNPHDGHPQTVIAWP